MQIVPITIPVTVDSNVAQDQIDAYHLCVTIDTRWTTDIKDKRLTYDPKIVSYLITRYKLWLEETEVALKVIEEDNELTKYLSALMLEAEVEIRLLEEHLKGGITDRF